MQGRSSGIVINHQGGVEGVRGVGSRGHVLLVHVDVNSAGTSPSVAVVDGGGEVRGTERAVGGVEAQGLQLGHGQHLANMYRLACKSKAIEENCRRLSCVYPGICSNLGTNHDPLIKIYRRARALKGIKKILIGSGLRYDLAVQSPEYVKELVQHHVGGYLKIAPEHTEQGPLTKMMKPGIGSYDKFKTMFEKFSAEAGKKQYLIPYFIAAHPGTSDEDMMNLAIWLKKNGFRADQVQTFYPSPMATATAMGLNGIDGAPRGGALVTCPSMVVGLAWPLVRP